jgi:transcriptional regulator with XRE-family HTH domain
MSKKGVVDMVVYNYDRLRGRMAEKGFTIKALAKKIGIHSNTLARKLYCESYLNTDEIRNIASALDITANELNDFFFMPNKY